MELEMTIY
jgi:hypothetical protein